jgi:cytochrome b561
MADAEATAAIAPRGYDRVAQTMHRLVATLALAVVWLGWAIAGPPSNTPQRDFFVRVDETIGLTILAAMVFPGGVGAIPHHHCRPLSPGSKRVSPGLTHFFSVSTPDPNAPCRQFERRHGGTRS